MYVVQDNHVEVAAREAGRLDALLDSLEQALAPEAERRGLFFIGSYKGPAALALDFDASALFNVLCDVVRRALAATRVGGIELALVATPHDDQAEVLISVRDMAPAAPGTGFDASVAEARLRDRAAAMGLRCWRERNPGQGEVVRLSFAAPLHRAQPVPVEVDLSPAAGPRILVVDDNATNLAVAKALCEGFGCVVETAVDGEEAVEAVGRARFDLILMDIRMPRMDGVAATRAIHAQEAAGRRTPILALTANNDHADVQTYLAAGMCAVVEKPIAPDQLLVALSAALAEPEAVDGERRCAS